MPMLRLIGKRISLRDWQFADFERYGFWLQPGQRWQELDGPYYPKPTGTEVEQILARLSAKIEAGRQVSHVKVW